MSVFSESSTAPAFDYTIVVPVYYNESVLPTTMGALVEEVVQRNSNLSCEIVFVDDGSGDGSMDELMEFHRRYPGLVKVVKLTRNFGQVHAILAALSLASGRCAVVISADNQDPAGLTNDMLDAHFREHYDIVVCARKGRDESLVRRWTSAVFYRVMRRISFPTMPAGGFDYLLLSRRAYRAILRSRDASPFFQGQVLSTGYRTKFIEYERRRRVSGESRWTFGRKFTYLIDGIMGYSYLPLRLMSAVGFLVAAAGFAYAAVIFVIRLVWGLPVQGWAPLMIMTLVLGGVQMLMLGVIGEYLWRVLAQVRGREPYIIEAVYGEFPSPTKLPPA